MNSRYNATASKWAVGEHCNTSLPAASSCAAPAWRRLLPHAHGGQRSIDTCEMPFVQCNGTRGDGCRCRYHGVANVQGGMFCHYHIHQSGRRLFPTACQACGDGPYFFPWPRVGFFCQQHKHVSWCGKRSGIRSFCALWLVERLRTTSSSRQSRSRGATKVSPLTPAPPRVVAAARTWPPTGSTGRVLHHPMSSQACAELWAAGEALASAAV